MKTYHVVRVGWNAANQSSMGRSPRPKNQFESGRYCYLGSVEASDEAEAKLRFAGTCYNNQYLFATANPRGIAGLTKAIRLHAEGW